MSNKISQKQGFTIIEVVLVLAIAGLIFLMVFVAFPALQRNQRDTQRRQDYADLSAAIISAATNSNGQLPAVGASTLGNDIGKRVDVSGGHQGTGPQGEVYTVTIAAAPDTAPSAPTTAGAITVFLHSSCGTGGNTPTKTGSTTDKRFAIYGFLENGSYCLEGQI